MQSSLYIAPENDPLSNVPSMYLVFEQIGPGHYDCVTESTQETEDLDNMENLKEFEFSMTIIQSNVDRSPGLNFLRIFSSKSSFDRSPSLSFIRTGSNQLLYVITYVFPCRNWS